MLMIRSTVHIYYCVYRFWPPLTLAAAEFGRRYVNRAGRLTLAATQHCFSLFVYTGRTSYRATKNSNESHKFYI